MYRVSKKSNCIFDDMGNYKHRERAILYTGRKVVKIILEAKLLSKENEMKPNAVVNNFWETSRPHEL